MSTRSTIVYAGPLHIYWEGINDEICIELCDEDDFKKNDQYGTTVISPDCLREIYEELSDYLKRNGVTK